MNVPVRSLLALSLVMAAPSAFAAPLVRAAGGANPAAIQAVVDQFRTDLGGLNNGVGGSFVNGRREINWDGVPDTFALPNFLPANFFNSNSARGVVFSAVDETTGLNQFIVSADASNPTSTAVRFGDLQAGYPAIFQTFSAERLFQVRNARALQVDFFIPGTTQRATVGGFGVVFADQDTSTGAIIRCFGIGGQQLAAVAAPPANNGLSFVGFTFDNPAERCYRVLIVSGNAALTAGLVDGAASDVIAMDDFIYGEPAAAL